MSKPLDDRQDKDTGQGISDPSPIKEVTAEQDKAAEKDQTVYRFLNRATGAEFPKEQVYHEAPTVTFGDVVEIQTPNGKPDYFSVDAVVEEGEISTVYLVRARNSLGKSILLLAILGASWFIIEYILKLIF